MLRYNAIQYQFLSNILKQMKAKIVLGAVEAQSSCNILDILIVFTEKFMSTN